MYYIQMFHELKWMKLALQEAKIAMNKNCIPIGTVIIMNNKLIAKAHNADFWHAEILAIQKAQKKVGKFLYDTKIFVTVKPCPMCMHAIKLARIKTVIYGADNQNEPLPNPEIIEGIYENDATLLLKDFFLKKR